MVLSSGSKPHFGDSSGIKNQNEMIFIFNECNQNKKCHEIHYNIISVFKMETMFPKHGLLVVLKIYIFLEKGLILKATESNCIK